MRLQDLIPGRRYVGPAGQVRELLAVSENQRRIRYRQITTSKWAGGGRVEPGTAHWIEAATFLNWIIAEAS